jgi:protein O-mannosyl-transferase
MDSESKHCSHPHALAAIIFLLVLGVTWLAYAPGMGGSLHFDDRESLAGLTAAHNWENAFDFVATAFSGPIGRPLALASFVPEAYAWPDLPHVFLRTNILIHLLNGVLVIWFLYLLGRARNQDEGRSALVATVAGGIWMLMPLLASSSLFIVQRMTTLAAVFSLLGAVGYLYARRQIQQYPFAALCGMTLMLGAGASLGMLAKENAALIFLFILAVESILLDPPDNVPRLVWRIWFSIVLITPLALLAFYIVSMLPYSDGTVLQRGFTGLQRLMTEAGILWKYLLLAFVPNIQSLGPFHDDYVVRRSLLDPWVLIPVTAWLIAIAAAVRLRRRAPLFSFAVAWYLLGHTLESTTLNLELYFEHRNYLPLVGPAYALVGLVAQLPPKLHRMASIAGASYAALLGAVLFSTTSLWGSPRMGAEIWYANNPNSLRAIHHLAGQLEQAEPPYVVERVLEQYLESNPDQHAIRIAALLVSCQLDPRSDHASTMQLLESELRTAERNFSILGGFEQLYKLSRDGNCPGLRKEAIYRLGQSLLENPQFQAPVVRHNVHAVLASMGVDAGNLESTMSHLEQALEATYDPATLAWAVEILISAGRLDLARQFAAEARTKALPSHALRAISWNRSLDRIEARLKSAEES